MEFGDLKRGRYRKTNTTQEDPPVVENKTVAEEVGDEVKINKSTWSNLWVKLKVLFPYLWQRESHGYKQE